MTSGDRLAVNKIIVYFISGAVGFQDLNFSNNFCNELNFLSRQAAIEVV